MAIALALETLAMPIMYKGIPVPYGGGTKPIGGVLFVATFFHLTLLAASAIAILYVARRLGMAPGELLPKSRTGWIDIVFLMILLVSGFVSWFAPLALIFFIISGVYLVASELE